MINNRINCVYILTNKKNSVLYIGVTSDLVRRVWQHKNHFVKGFTEKYNVDKLVFYEVFELIIDAIEREKYLKGKKRAYKLNLINKLNPCFKDLYEDII